MAAIFHQRKKFSFLRNLIKEVNMKVITDLEKENIKGWDLYVEHVTYCLKK